MSNKHDLNYKFIIAIAVVWVLALLGFLFVGCGYQEQLPPPDVVVEIKDRNSSSKDEQKKTIDFAFMQAGCMSSSCHNEKTSTKLPTSEEEFKASDAIKDSIANKRMPIGGWDDETIDAVLKYLDSE